MTGGKWYEAYGYVIASDIDLPLRQADAVGSPHLALRMGEPMASTHDRLDAAAEDVIASMDIGEPEGPWYVVTDRGTGYRIVFRGAGAYDISRDLTTVTCSPASGGDAHLLPTLFSGTVLALIMTLEERLVLHASAVSFRGRTTAFVGHSGRGKSTVAALCAAAGASMITDDLLLVRESDAGVWECRGNAHEFRLRDGARPVAERLAGLASRRETEDDRLGITPFAAESGWMPLHTLILPSPSEEGHELQVRQLTGQQALLCLTRFPRISGLRAGRLLSLQFETQSRMLAHVPMLEATIPWGPPFSDDLPEQLVSLGQDTPVGPGPS